MTKVSSAVCILFVLGCLTSLAQQEPQGVLIYRQPSATFTEAIEYWNFRQDNALYSSFVTSNGVHKQVTSGSVVEVIPFPPATSQPLFEETATTTLSKIEALQAAYPQVKPQLETVRLRWAGALDVFRQLHQVPPPVRSAPRLSHEKERKLPPEARLTGATSDAATITYASGVTTIPLDTLKPAQILSLNATSRAFQLPLGTERALAPLPVPAPISPATERIERVGRNAIAFFSRTLGLADTTFSVWTFFVVLPGLILGLLIAVLLLARTPRATPLPRHRPVAPSL